MQRKDFKGPQANRNYIICQRYVLGYTSPEIAQYLLEKNYWHGNAESVASLCRKVIYKNRASLKIDKDYEIIKDVLRIEREIDNRPLGKKDKIDLIKAKHEVLNADKPLIDQSQHHTLQIVSYGEKVDNTNPSRRLQAA